MHDMLGRLSGWKGGFTVIVLVFLAGFGASSAIGEFGSHEIRITGLEEWRDLHEDTVTFPRALALARLQSEQSRVSDRLRRIEVLVSCMYYEIERCPDPAPNPPPSGGGGQ